MILAFATSQPTTLDAGRIVSAGNLTASLGSGECIVVGDKKAAIFREASGNTSVLKIMVYGKGEYVPKTELGRVLWERRKKIIAKGEPLRPAKEILEELAASRDG